MSSVPSKKGAEVDQGATTSPITKFLGIKSPKGAEGEDSDNRSENSQNISQFKGYGSENGSMFAFGGNPTFRQKVQLRKEKNIANQNLAQFRRLIQKKQVGSAATLTQDKLKLLPITLESDAYEALLYLYFTVRYFDEHIFKVILSRTQNLFGIDSEVQILFKDSKSYSRLTTETSFDRIRLNKACFETALEKDYMDVAFHFIENGYIQITWDMVRKMLSNRQEYLVKQCIKYQCKFDNSSAQVKKIVFAGRAARSFEDRTIRLVDFIQIMLELKWKSSQVIFVLCNYSKKGKIDNIDLRELFLIFAMKRKLKLMSHMINSEDFHLEFTEENFIDVVENEVYDIAVLLYREYFLLVKDQRDRITTLLVSSFQKANGMLESKCFLLRRFISRQMRYDQAVAFLEAVEDRINDSSRGNLLVHTLNVLKSACLLIELLELVKNQFSYMTRRVNEIRAKITQISVQFMNEVQTEDEMRFLLLEKDLDSRDALNLIFDNQIVELLRHPFAQNIVYAIWNSPYNNCNSIFSASSAHTLLWNYNHVRFDMETQLRFYRKRDLNNIGCHGFQFQVWRYAGSSRYLVSAITTLIFVLIIHYQIAQHEAMALFVKQNVEFINYSFKVTDDPSAYAELTKDQIALQQAYAGQWMAQLQIFYASANKFIILFYLQWMYVFQLFYNAMFAGRNKRYMKYFSFENLLDTVIMLVEMAYLSILLRDYRYDTFLKIRTEQETVRVFYDNYISSPVNENIILLILGILFWIKAFIQLKYLELFGSLYQIMRLLVFELMTFILFYVAVVFIYGIIGVVLFSNDIPEFAHIWTAMFTLFRASIKDYSYDMMNKARVGEWIANIYFNSFLIFNLIFLVNLIVAQLAYAYKFHFKEREVLYLLSTLSVREVSEADEKYSAVISAPFPVNILNLVFGSIVLGVKNPKANVVLLHFYFLPINLVCLVLFSAYQLVILPFAYVKVLGHKWALCVKAPQGKGSSTSLDRAGQFVLFFIFGPVLLIFNVIVDTFWYLAHVYKMDLDKSSSSKAFSVDKELVEVHRRTYKKMLRYFQTQNDQLVLQNQVAADLRTYLDVEEGLRCMIWGKPDEISEDKVALYMTYAKKNKGKATENDVPEDASSKDSPQAMDALNDDFFSVEKVVHEFSTIKKVLINNAIPVDLTEIETGVRGEGRNTKGWGMRVLFDKKVFLSLLTELESMRKILQVKKMFYIFHVPYEGKPEAMSEWYDKVAKRTTQTLKFLNSARLLRIIGYDPTQYIKPQTILTAKSHFKPNAGTVNLGTLRVQQQQMNRREDARASVASQSGLGLNLVNLVTRYTSAGEFLNQMTEVIRSVNQTQAAKPAGGLVQGLLRYPESSPEQITSIFEKQVRLNSLNPTASGVISSPEPSKQTSIQRIDGAPSQSFKKSFENPPKVQKKEKIKTIQSEDEGANLTMSDANLLSDGIDSSREVKESFHVNREPISNPYVANPQANNFKSQQAPRSKFN